MSPRWLLLSVALIIGLAACSGDSDDDADTTTTVDSADTSTTAADSSTTAADGDTGEPATTAPPDLADDAVVLSVNGVETTEAELRAELAAAAEFAEANEGAADFFLTDAAGNSSLEVAREILQQLVESALADEDLAARGGEVTDADVAQVDGAFTGFTSTPWFELFKERNAVSVALQRIIQTELGLPATAEEWFAANAEPLGFACSRHILLETVEDAIAARERVVDGGEDFATVAMEASTGPTGPNGGDLGCGDPAGFVPEFAEAVRALPIGEISEPVETQFGFHVIEVTARGADITFAQAGDAALLAYEQAISGVVSAELAELTTSAEVTIEPAYGSWDGSQILP